VGLDCRIKKWSMEKGGKALKDIDVMDVFKGEDGKTSTIISLPFLCSIETNQRRDVLVTGTQTGHIIGYSGLKDPRFSFVDDSHLGRVDRV
jgi:hypothetical protein